MRYDERVTVHNEQSNSRVVGAFRVSVRGQLSLPAEIRRRWGLERGGPVEVVDLGDAVLLVPGGSGTLWQWLREAIPPEQYKRIVAQIGRDDPALATQ